MPLAAIHDFIQVLANYPEMELVMGSRVRPLGREIERNPARHYAGRVYATFPSLACRDLIRIRRRYFRQDLSVPARTSGR